eukprot:1633460-Amphidinium_carterae.2
MFCLHREIPVQLLPTRTAASPSQETLTALLKAVLRHRDPSSQCKTSAGICKSAYTPLVASKEISLTPCLDEVAIHLVVGGVELYRLSSTEQVTGSLRLHCSSNLLSSISGGISMLMSGAGKALARQRIAFMHRSRASGCGTSTPWIGIWIAVGAVERSRSIRSR